MADYKIGQRSAVRWLAIETTGNGVSVPPNPTRLALIVAWSNTNYSVRVEVGQPLHLIATGGVIDSNGGLTEAGTDLYSLKDYGTLVLGSLFVVNVPAQGAVYVSEVYALDDLDTALARLGSRF